MAFNNFANPKIEIKRFKIYINTGTSANPSWELQGRGVGSWSQDMNQDVSKESDVLGFVDMERGVAQRAFTGIDLKLRKESALSSMIQHAVETNDFTALDSVDILQKYEYVDGETTGNCHARLDKGCMIGVNSYGGEAGGYITANVDFHLSNDIVLGEMAIVDESPVEFIPNEDDEDDEDGEEPEE